MAFAQRTTYVFILLACILVNAFHAYGQNATEKKTKSFLWEVKSATSTAYLFGSIHYADSSFYPLKKSIEDAFRESSFLVVELNPLTVDEIKMQQLILQKGIYPGNQTIEDNISAESYGMLKTYLAQQNIPIQGFSKMRPGILALALSSLQIMKMGYSPLDGVDIYFARKAGNEKSIIELETVEEQLSLVFGMADESALLKYTLMDLDKTDTVINSLITSWKAGDSEAMDNLVVKRYGKYPELQPIMKKMFFDRNIKMVEKIKGLLTTGEKYFVVVGAGHLVGEQGIVQLLHNQGFAVRQL